MTNSIATSVPEREPARHPNAMPCKCRANAVQMPLQMPLQRPYHAMPFNPIDQNQKNTLVYVMKHFRVPTLVHLTR
jgi:hypothetical protein